LENSTNSSLVAGRSEHEPWYAELKEASVYFKEGTIMRLDELAGKIKRNTRVRPSRSEIVRAIVESALDNVRLTRASDEFSLRAQMDDAFRCGSLLLAGRELT